jgi:hypothetical protein
MIAGLRFAIGAADVRRNEQINADGFACLIAQIGSPTIESVPCLTPWVVSRPPERSRTLSRDVEKAKAGESSIHRPSGVANWLRNFTSISILSKTDR